MEIDCNLEAFHAPEPCGLTLGLLDYCIEPPARALVASVITAVRIASN